MKKYDFNTYKGVLLENGALNDQIKVESMSADTP
jgi:hypothetical protein